MKNPIECNLGMEGVHAFIFLRQEEKNIACDRNPVYLVQDVFFCSKCLTYERVDVEKRTPRNDGTSYTEKLV